MNRKGKNNPMFGRHHSQQSRMKTSESMKGKNAPWFGVTGKDHPHYKEKLQYHYLHTWIRKIKGPAKKCKDCGSTKRVNWSNKDHKYRRVLADYVERCERCHVKYDKEKGLR